MKWITREHVKVDRVACPWLIKKFVDPDAELLFVPRVERGDDTEPTEKVGRGNTLHAAFLLSIFDGEGARG